ncbi:MAG: 3-hydroxyacyl-(acyl-carrier-protein) dehydratase FabZ [Syntrophaceae bacterium PtaB.Bin095]|jgi:3-hydroxyacyl-[acyl-carrier-protein] dehydratase|nr:MAG: 3-hydroxyacyl-(acyl-carrier-protein) dehydratase FabZ [Syntrophaceae bacterium PtaB.Bin095]
MAADEQMKAIILKAIPQQPPFRFIDELLELDDDRSIGAYRFRPDEYFYRGHFPGRPVTPGVILIEAMAQTSIVAHGLYLSMKKSGSSPDDLKRISTLFTCAETVEFTGIVAPGERIVFRGEKVYFRMGSLKAKIVAERETGEVVCRGTLAGMGVRL